MRFILEYESLVNPHQRTFVNNLWNNNIVKKNKDVFLVGYELNGVKCYLKNKLNLRRS